MILAVFARETHPPGYGGISGIAGCPNYRAPENVRMHQQSALDRGARPAHGYVILVVECADIEELAKVTERLHEWWEYPGRNDGWYGGSFDLVWHGEIEAVMAAHRTFQIDHGKLGATFPIPIGQANSYGDNRACAYLDALDILEGDST